MSFLKEINIRYYYKPDIAYRGVIVSPFDYVEMLCIQRS